MSAFRRIGAGLVILALCAMALGLGYMVRVALPGLGTGPAMADGDAPPAATDAAPAGTDTAPATTPAETPTPAATGAAVTPAAVTPAAMPQPPQARAELWVVKGRNYGRVFLGEKVVLPLVFPSDGVEPSERASAAAAQLNLALQDGARPDDFRAEQDGTRWLVAARGHEVIRIAPGEAKGFKTTDQGLATKWAADIAGALDEVLYGPPAGGPLPPLPAEGRELAADGRPIGVLIIADREVLRIVSGAAGMSPFERVKMVADRLKQAMADGARADDIRSADVYGMKVVQVSETLLITVDHGDAVLTGKTEEVLARDWASSLQAAVTGFYAQPGRPPKPGEWVPEEAYGDKWVPILSILSGTRVGAARVSGPVSRADLVQGVGQLELNTKLGGMSVEMDVYIPISTKVPGKTIDRIKAVGVTGLADIKL